MKLFRFIGIAEFDALCRGEIVVNTTDHSKRYNTNSKGFCFFANNRTNDYEKIFVSAYEYLSGIVDDYYMIEAEISNPRKAWGYYSVGKKTEYNVESYSMKDVRKIYRLKGSTHYRKGFYHGKKYYEGKVYRIVEGIEEW